MRKLEHLGIIPDGNRRWAKRNKKSYIEAYSVGIKKVEDIIEWWSKTDISYLSIYVLSYENLLNRKKEELNILFKLFSKYIKENLRKILKISNENEIKIRFVGEKEKLPENLKKQINDLEEETEGYSKKNLNLLVAYSGRREILSAISKLNREFNEENFAKNLWISKDIDLIIRTGGYRRLSNFLLFQSAYAELYFIDKLWPDVTIEDIKKAINWYYNVKRNFGK